MRPERYRREPEALELTSQGVLDSAMEVYLVGGAVRDELLGLAVSEHDWVVVGSSPEAMLEAGFRQVGRDFPVFLHPETHDEWALARTERKVGAGHTGFVCHAGPDVTLEEDLARRDLTINAMARTESGGIVDLFGGRRDLEGGWLRHVSPAFVEDPLRVFRVARFAASMPGFGVAPETVEIMRGMRDVLDELAAERVFTEFRKALDAPAPERFLEVLRGAGCLYAWLGELWAVDDLPGRDALGRFGHLGIVLGEASIGKLGRRIKVPNDFARLARQMARHGEVLSKWRDAGPEVLYDAAESILIRSGAHWLDVVLDALVDSASLPDLEALREILLRLPKIGDGARYIDEGLQGPEIGRRIRMERIDYLRTATGG